MGAQDDYPPAAEIAAQIRGVVEERYGAHDHLSPRDLNDVYLYLGYARAFRCFDTICLLAGEERSDDALILIRSLLSVALRSLYLVQPDDAAEREVRRRRSVHDALAKEETRVRLLADARDAEQLAALQTELGISQQWFDESEVSSALPGDADIAEMLGLDFLYNLVYRIASHTTHHSLLAALGGFAGEPEPTGVFAPVPLHKPEPELAENALVWAIAAYATFLKEAETSVRLGVAVRVEPFVMPWLENHPYRRQLLDD